MTVLMGLLPTTNNISAHSTSLLLSACQHLIAHHKPIHDILSRLVIMSPVYVISRLQYS